MQTLYKCMKSIDIERIFGVSYCVLYQSGLSPSCTVFFWLLPFAKEKKEPLVWKQESPFCLHLSPTLFSFCINSIFQFWWHQTLCISFLWHKYILSPFYTHRKIKLQIIQHSLQEAQPTPTSPNTWWLESC